MAWYEYPSNYSNGTSVDGFGSFIHYISTISNSALGLGFLFIIFLGSFGLTMVSGSNKALLVSSFITFVFSIYFVRLGMINLVIPIVLVILVIIGALLSKDSKGL